ncbi:uncharacterized protein [Spinacia oleracea]|uniref:Uncharacterized protein isoform X2 n=1 Tax=Spinacia oleracea TaxID=3562 RepID=A0ABM3QJ99_SPIOL|nr:uncharacterized protein LOC110778263 isoform X2 [Spinacia oleracea]
MEIGSLRRQFEASGHTASTVDCPTESYSADEAHHDQFGYSTVGFVLSDGGCLQKYLEGDILAQGLSLETTLYMVTERHEP